MFASLENKVAIGYTGKLQKIAQFVIAILLHHQSMKKTG